jgi:hypothetical protein
LKLVDEVTRWTPDGTGGGTDDCVMSEWQFEHRLPGLWRPSRPLKPQPRPSWMLQPTA